MPDTSALLDPAGLKSAATAATGLGDFGDASFEEPLAILCHALGNEASLSASGLIAQHQRLVALLTQRLLLEEWIRREPAILDEVIAAPLFIVGLPRTGTTVLYRMLAVAEGFVAPLHYQAVEPAPALDWDFAAASDPRIPRAEAAIAAMVAASPELNAIYPFEALAPEESIYLLSPALRCTSAPSLALVPSYHQWFMGCDKGPAYRYLRRTLQLLQWQQRRQNAHFSPRRWLLKTPDHIHSLGELIAEFPDARVIQTHRDPLKTIPSICSFIRALHLMSTAAPDAQAIGDSWCTMFATSMTAALAVRDRHPGVFCDIQFADTVARPRQVAEEIFAFLGQELAEPVWMEMEKWREANQREARPAHDYSLADFGLSDARIREQFAAYRHHYVRS